MTPYVALVFVVLLVVEWWKQLWGARLAAVVLALVVLFFAQAGVHRAARQAVFTPVAERETSHVPGEVLSEYEVGVYTMERAMAEDFEIGRDARLLALAVLVWLACSPMVRRALAGAREHRTIPASDPDSKTP